MLKGLMEKCRERKKEMFICFVDLQKAFDRVDRGEMWSCLERRGVGGRLLRAFRSLYKIVKHV